MPELLVGTVTDNNGLGIDVWATESNGNTTFRIAVESGSADLRGFFFDYEGLTPTLVATRAVTASNLGTSADGDDITKVGGADNNMNGRGETFDAGLQFGTAGIGKDDISTVTFTINDLTLSEIDGLSFGIRATSVGADRSDDVKLIGAFDVPENAAPVFTSGETASIPENSPTTQVVYDADATDSDGDTRTYSLSQGGDNDLFNIDSSTGEVTFKQPPNFEAPADAGVNNIYNITVHANDGTDDASKGVAITVTDVARDLLAVAFTDQNGNHTYEPDTDLLIASLRDTNTDEVVSIGDTIHWGTFPTTFDGSGTRGTFTSSDSLVSFVFSANNTDVTVLAENFLVVDWQATPFSLGLLERFLVNKASTGSFSSSIVDQSGSSFPDRITVDPAATPTNTPVDTSLSQPGNQGFLDILLF
jgi:Cadherin domain